MNLLFYGLLFLNLNLTLNIGNNVINLLPAFIGMILLAKGMNRLRAQSRYFANSSSMALMFSFYAAAVWLMDFFGVTPSLAQQISLGIGIAQTAMVVYLTYILTIGMKELEKVVHADLNADSLKLFWYFSLVLNIGTYIGIWVPIIALLCLIMNFFISIVYIVTFYKGAKNYNQAVYGAAVINVKE